MICKVCGKNVEDNLMDICSDCLYESLQKAKYDDRFVVVRR